MWRGGSGLTGGLEGSSNMLCNNNNNIFHADLSTYICYHRKLRTPFNHFLRTVYTVLGVLINIGRVRIETRVIHIEIDIYKVRMKNT